MNDVLGSLKWIVGAIIIFVGLYLGLEAYKAGESILASIGIASFGAAFLIVAGLLGDPPGGSGGISQEDMEHYRASRDEANDGDGWHD